MRAPLNWIDVAAILPWYVIEGTGANVQGTGMLRVLRLARILRVLRVGGQSDKMRIVASSLANSVDLLGLMLAMLSLAVLIFSTILYFLEHGELNADTGLYQREGARSLILFFRGWGGGAPLMAGGAGAGGAALLCSSPSLPG